MKWSEVAKVVENDFGMPRMFVKPLDECDDYELNNVGIRTDDMNDEFVRD